MRAGALRAIAVATGALALAGCGGGGAKTPGGTSPSIVGGISTPGATDATIQIAQQIKSRLTAAGYVVHDIPKGTPYVRGPLDQTAIAHGPQQTFVAVDKTTDLTYGRLNDELVSIRAKARARAVKNLPMTPQTFKLLATLSANIKELGYHEFDVYVFNSSDDAASYAKSSFDAVDQHVLSLPGANDYEQYENVGPVIYFRPLVENDGKFRLDKAGFAKLVAVAQGTK